MNSRENEIMFFNKKLVFLAAIVFLFSCHQHDNKQANDSAEATENNPGNNQEFDSKKFWDDIKNKNVIDVPANVRKNLGITFAKAEKRQLTEVLRVPGEFEFLPRAHRHYHANLEGRVELKIDLLDKVAVGQLLYVLDSPAWLELKQELIKVTNDIKNLETTLSLSSSDKKATAARRVQQILLEKASLYTGLSVAQLEKNITVDGKKIPHWLSIKQLQINAQNEGVVESLDVTNGEWVALGSKVVSVVDMNQVRFRANLLQDDLALIQDKEKAFISIPHKATGSIQTVNAAIVNQFLANNNQRSFQIYATAEEMPDWIKPGVAGYLEIILDETESPVLAIPKTAIVRDGLVDIFFRRDPKNPNKVFRTELDGGVDDGQWIELKSGAMVNDQVIINGRYELNIAYSATKGSEQKKGGHFHADGTWHDEDH